MAAAKRVLYAAGWMDGERGKGWPVGMRKESACVVYKVNSGKYLLGAFGSNRCPKVKEMRRTALIESRLHKACIPTCCFEHLH